MHNTCKAALAFLTIIAAWVGAARAETLPWDEANEIVAEVTPPTFPDQVFSVTTYGADGTGVHDSTTAFSEAIEACNAAGGGKVEVPAGTYTCGAIELLSNVDLDLASGATIKFSNNKNLYSLVHTRYQGIDLMNFSPLVHAANQTNVALTGEGTLDASATSAWNVDGASNFTALESQETKGVAIAQRIYGPTKPLRTVMVEMYNCSNVLIQGVAVINSHFWQIHPCLSTNVTIDSVVTDATTAQTDGVDVEACTGVVIENCDLTAGDDCVAVKAGRNADPLRVHKPSQYIVVKDCTCDGPQGMIVCGSEVTDGVQHIYGYNLTTRSQGVKYGFFVKSNTLRGGYARDIHMDTISGRFVTAVVYGTLTYNSETGPNLPAVGDVYLSNFSDTSAGQVVDMTGLSNDFIQDVELSDSAFTGVAKTSNTETDANVTFTNVTINGESAAIKKAGVQVLQTVKPVPMPIAVHPTAAAAK